MDKTNESAAAAAPAHCKRMQVNDTKAGMQNIDKEKINQIILEKEIEKSTIDANIVQKLVRPTTVMFDPLQKSLLIGYFTEKD